MAYNLRSTSGTLSPEEPEIVPASPGSCRQGTGASHKSSQQKFLEMMGLVEDTVSRTFRSDILTDDHAAILASAMNHSYYEETKQYYVPEEYRRICRNFLHSRQTFLTRARKVVSSGENVVELASLLVDDFEREPMECQCPAHILHRGGEESPFHEAVAELMLVPQPLTDHWGGILAGGLLPILIKSAGLKMSVRHCRAGSPYEVNFLLKLPSGYSYQFVGRPDFTINQKPSGPQLRNTLQCIGEVQSPPGDTEESRTAALAQAGNYTVGQFANGQVSESTSSLAAVILHKDKSAQVAIATVRRDRNHLPNSVGQVSFKLVERVDPIDLTSAAELRTFASLFCGIIEDPQS